VGLGYGFGMTQRISWRELGENAADILRRVEQGESFVVTRDGNPSAHLIPRGIETRPNDPLEGSWQRH
jgi:prevent-host-death family protein